MRGERGKGDADIASDVERPRSGQLVGEDQAFWVVTTVFTAIRDRIPEDEVAAVASQFPADLADLFRRPV